MRQAPASIRVTCPDIVPGPVIDAFAAEPLPPDPPLSAFLSGGAIAPADPVVDPKMPRAPLPTGASLRKDATP